MTAPNPQAGPLTGLDVGADGAGLPHPAPRQPRIVHGIDIGQDHPAAVHMQRIATELELRYGLGIEVRS